MRTFNCKLVVFLSLATLLACDEDEAAMSPMPETFARVDRMGMPAVATAVITSKEAYNAADPSNDAAGDFVGEITANLTTIHNALDDDLTGLGLTPATVNEAVAQAAPLVVPDVIALDTTVPSGFPNGRQLADTVIDVTLAVVLLDINGLGSSNGPHTPTTIVGVNPTANDRAFSGAFPYLAQPNQP